MPNNPKIVSTVSSVISRATLAETLVADATTPVKLDPGKPVTTTTAKLLVAGMQPGTYTFQLEVTDNLGASSQATLKVQVTAIVLR